MAPPHATPRTGRRRGSRRSGRPAARRTYRQLLDKAAAALEREPSGQRGFRAAIIAVDSRRLEDAHNALRRFCEAFVAEYGAAGEKDEVMCLGLQLFSLRDGDGTAE